MRWSYLWWLAVVAVVALEGKWSSAAPSPQTEDMLKTLLELDRMYSAVARPRFGKRGSNDGSFAGYDYEGQQYQEGDLNDWLPARR